MSMTRAALAADLKTSLRDAASAFTAVADADFLRLIDIATGDMHRVRPLVRVAGFNFDSDAVETNAYPVPVDFVDFHSAIWGSKSDIPMWDPGYVDGYLMPHAARCAAGRVLCIAPPSMAQRNAYGSRYSYRYFASPVEYAIGFQRAHDESMTWRHEQ